MCLCETFSMKLRSALYGSFLWVSVNIYTITHYLMLSAHATSNQKSMIHKSWDEQSSWTLSKVLNVHDPDWSSSQNIVTLIIFSMWLLQLFFWAYSTASPGSPFFMPSPQSRMWLNIRSLNCVHRSSAFSLSSSLSAISFYSSLSSYSSFIGGLLLPGWIFIVPVLTLDSVLEK